MKPMKHNKHLSWAKITVNPRHTMETRGPLRSLCLRPLEASRQPVVESHMLSKYTNNIYYILVYQHVWNFYQYIL